MKQFIKNQLKKVLPATRQQATWAVKNTQELLWAEVFNRTISGSTWLLNQSFSPGRMALSWLGLYLLYRVLDEFRPQSILELGLGQSTKMISQFAQANPSCVHYVVENNEEWARFYKNSNAVPENTKITLLDVEMKDFKGARVRTYQNFKETFGDKRFNFIAIDAPVGGDMKDYARVDVLSILPECLGQSFVITLDDAQRSGEANTAAQISEALNAGGVKYKAAVYHGGERDVALWASEDWGFLCSL